MSQLKWYELKIKQIEVVFHDFLFPEMREGCHLDIVGWPTARTFSLSPLFKIPVCGGGSHFPLFARKKGEMKRGHGKTSDGQEQRQTTWRMEKSSSAWCNNKEASLNKRIAPTRRKGIRTHVRKKNWQAREVKEETSRLVISFISNSCF